MKLQRVTITGADDSVDPEDLAILSDEFPFVEWGILFSLSNIGGPRFPTYEWTRKLRMGPSYSAHLCGRYVRDLVLEANCSWLMSPVPHELFTRVQLNFHGQFHRQHRNLVGRLLEDARGIEREYIFQCDGVNDDAVRSLCAQDYRFTPLFDTSGGAGRLPSEWPEAWEGVYCGYAGGLGPENIERQLAIIGEHTHNQPFWIDMERRVRSEDDSKLDLKKVRTVLLACAPFIEEVPT